MRKSPVLLVLLASLFLASPLLSQRRPENPEPEAGMRGKPVSSLPSTPLSQRAFYSLAGELIPPGVHELRFEVRIDGQPALLDVIRLPFDAASGTVELLAGDPDGLARLLARAEKAGRNARFSVILDGRTLETFTLSEFLAYNRRFQDVPPAVLKPLSEIRTFGPDGEPATPPGKPQGQLTKGYDPVCVAGCEAERDYCYETEPSCATVRICEVCEDQYGSCHQSCWVCTDPVSTSEFTTSSLHSATWFGSSCLEDFFGSKEWYDSYAYVIRNYRWRRTNYCNGTHTDTLLYTWDASGSCIRRSFGPCSFSFGTAWPPYCPF